MRYNQSKKLWFEDNYPIILDQAFRSYFKFIPILRGDINLNSEPITAIYINKSWDDLPICNYNLSINLA